MLCLTLSISILESLLPVVAPDYLSTRFDTIVVCEDQTDKVVDLLC